MKKSVKNRSAARSLRRVESIPAAPNAPVPTEISQQVSELRVNIQKATGTGNSVTAERLLQQAANALVWPRPKPESVGEQLIQAVATMIEIGPKTATEAMLAIQLVATHEAALMFLRNATTDDQTFEMREANAQRATRLMRLHLEQIEAMQKLKGRTAQQKVTVEHVHVHEGGQAIVGVVSARAQVAEGG